MNKEKKMELQRYIDEFQISNVREIKTEENKKTFIKIKKAEYELKCGSKVTREEIMKGNRDGSAVTIIPITSDYNVVLTVQPRVLKSNSASIEFPAGYIDDGEMPLDAAIRELEEETGYTSNDLMEIASYYQDQGCSRAFNHTFIAFDCEKTKNQNLDADEYIRYFECPLEDLDELFNDGMINDANSLIAYYSSLNLIHERTNNISNIENIETENDDEIIK